MIRESQAECGNMLLKTSMLQRNAMSLQKPISTRGLRSADHTNTTSVRTRFSLLNKYFPLKTAPTGKAVYLLKPINALQYYRIYQ